MLTSTLSTIQSKFEYKLNPFVQDQTFTQAAIDNLFEQMLKQPSLQRVFTCSELDDYKSWFVRFDVIENHSTIDRYRDDFAMYFSAQSNSQDVNINVIDTIELDDFTVFVLEDTVHHTAAPFTYVYNEKTGLTEKYVRKNCMDYYVVIQPK